MEKKIEKLRNKPLCQLSDEKKKQEEKQIQKMN